MSFVSDLFGGSKSSSSSTPSDLTPGEFKGLRGPLAERLKGLLKPGGIPSPQGPTTAQLTPAETDLLAQISANPFGQSQLFGQSRDLLERTLGGEFLTPESNPFLQAAIEAAVRPIRENFERSVVPNLRADFTRGGQLVGIEGGSSPFQAAIAQAGQDFTNTIADTAAEISFGNFEAERARQQEAVGQAQELSATELNDMVNRLQASALPRLIEQHGLNAGIEQFNKQLEVLLQVLNLGLGAAGATPVNTSVGESETRPNPFEMIFGADPKTGSVIF